MTDYKIIASDLDGTLLDNSSKISHENLEAIKKLTEKGVFFVPSTGRSLSELPKVIADIPDVRYVISSNGAAIDDRKTGNRILKGIENEKVKKLLDIFYSYEMYLSFRKDGKLFVDAESSSKENFEYNNVCKEHANVVEKYAVCLENFRETVYKSDNVESMVAFFHDKNVISECRKKIEALGGIIVVQMWDNLEVMSDEAGKGKALVSLAESLGLSADDTISMGDGDNDRSMIKAAGLGLVVSNGKDSLKNICDKVICSNEEHAVKYVLEHFFS